MPEITTQDVQLTVDGKQTGGHLALPCGDGPWPGVVVIQEWWGLNDHIRDIANRFAAEGFVAVAPDLYFGAVATEPDDARKLRMAMEWDQALDVIQAAVDSLVALEDVAPKRAGIIGFCMGGGLAWHGAAKLHSIGAAVPFYGGGPEMTAEEVAQCQVPVLAIYGELDQGVSPDVAAQRAALMDAAGVSHETIVYPDAQHAFFNDTRPVFHAEAAADAWERVLTFFRRNLR